MRRNTFGIIVTLQLAALTFVIAALWIWPALGAAERYTALNWTHVEDVPLPSAPFTVQPNYYRLRWDRGMLFHFRTFWTEPSPLVSGYLGGRALNVLLSPLEEMPDLKKLCVDDIAFAPTGETVLLGTVTFKSKPQKIEQWFLIYDSAGTLVRKFDADPYEYSRIAVGDDGTLFAFGTKVRARKDEDYPLVSRLTLEGKMLGGFHPRNLYNPETKPTDLDPFGPPMLLSQDGRIALFVGATGEFYEYDIDGNPIRRLSVEKELASLKREFKRQFRKQLPNIKGLEVAAGVFSLAWQGSERLLLQIRVLVSTIDGDTGTVQHVQFRNYELDDVGRLTQLGPATALPTPGTLLGFDSKGRAVFVRTGPSGERLLSSYVVN
jgi:hypothetical protein